jgi:hypothetical protein
MKILDIPQSGKCGVVVSLGGRTGQYRRILVIPGNPQTEPQLLIRNFLGNAASLWRQITEPQRLAWIAAAAQERSRPRLGQSGPLSGIQLFNKINCSLLLVGEAAVSDVPAKPQFPTLPVTGLTITNTSGTIAAKLACSDDLELNTIVRASAPVSVGIYKQTNLRYLGTAPVVSGGYSTITSLYTAEFGVPTVGKKVFVTVNQCIDGWQDIAHKFSAVVPASS